ncbi:hypothetical protein Aple_053040 [Acrocarpospora pleiomorpha]|uniref:Uncharacterized protein n=1 Tax=Acrocarpospora pleiomorpha TaxID=90975 RepID=A0A5M3XLZ8_9ACTN|nr:hypothetical protein [Acrocarpospora pleiomorpha]GES22407.1 hypothetical protein Aple_053040 [Acrocarpospora pleiomorpha]
MHTRLRRGYIALTSNRFQDVETYLAKATELAPDDKFSLADTLVRQDKLDRAVPFLEKAGNKPYATHTRFPG